MYYNTQKHSLKLKPEISADYIFENITISQIYNGELEFQVQAKKAVIYEDDNIVRLEESEGTLLESEESLLLFTSPKANYHLDDYQLNLDKAHVAYVVNEKALWLYTDALQWLPLSLQATSSGNATIITDEIQIESTLMAFDMKEKRITLKNNPQLRIAKHE